MGAAGRLLAADPAALIIRCLRGSSDLQTVLGGAGRVGGGNTPPYPRVVMTDQPGGLVRPTVWLVDTEYLFEVFGDPDGRHGRGELRAIMLTVVGCLSELPQSPATFGDPVVTSVAFFGSGGYSPTGAGQKRYVATATVTAHP